MMPPIRRVLMAAGSLLLAATIAAAGATSAAPKPVIGAPVAKPATPVAGKPFTVSYKVTRSDTGKPLTTGKMICDPSSAGKEIAHAESFKAGIAKLTFVIPSSAKLLKVNVTIVSGGQSAKKVSTFKVTGGYIPTLSVADATVAEGNAGTGVLSFPVALSAKSTDTVSVDYATADGTATQPGDYATASGTLTFKPGETAKTISILVVGDLNIEPDETVTVILSNPINATLARSSATGIVSNDDTAVPVMPGSYKGATQNGDYVFFSVTGNRTLTGFRVNNIKETCSPGGYLTGTIDWTQNIWTIGADGTFAAQGSWTGSQVQGDYEWTAWSARVFGRFTGASVNGTLTVSDELKYRGQPYKCSSGEITWAATLQG